MTDEVSLATKAMVSIFVFDLLAIALAFFAPTVNGGLPNPSVVALKGISTAINVSSTNMGNAFIPNSTVKLFGVSLPTTPIPSAPIISNIGINFVINGVWDLLIFVISMLDLLVVGIVSIAVLLFVVIPTLFTGSFGQFAPIFTLAHGVVLVVIGIYAFSLIRSMLPFISGRQRTKT